MGKNDVNGIYIVKYGIINMMLTIDTINYGKVWESMGEYCG